MAGLRNFARRSIDAQVTDLDPLGLRRPGRRASDNGLDAHGSSRGENGLVT